MKRLFILFFSLLLTAPAFAVLSLKKQREVIESLAKEDRHLIWKQGASEVTSYIESNRVSVNSWMKEHSNTLNAKQKAMISECWFSNQCKIYTIDLSYKTYGNWALDRRWVLLNPNSGKYQTFKHHVSAEE